MISRVSGHPPPLASLLDQICYSSSPKTRGAGDNLIKTSPKLRNSLPYIFQYLLPDEPHNMLTAPQAGEVALWIVETVQQNFRDRPLIYPHLPLNILRRPLEIVSRVKIYPWLVQQESCALHLLLRDGQHQGREPLIVPVVDIE